MRALLLAATLAAAAPAAAQAQAQAPTVQVVELGKLFPFLDLYYRLPLAERTHFTLAYRLMRGDKPANAALTVLDGGAATPLPVGPDGWVERPPTPEMFARKAKLRIEAPPGPAIAHRMAPEALVPIGPEMDPRLLAVAADQVNAAIRHASGVLGFAVPHLSQALFARAEGAIAVSADGRATPLPLLRGTPAYDPAVLKDVKLIRFAKPPARVFLIPGK